MTATMVFNLFVLPVVLAGAHGYFTNWIAVKLLMKPVRPINVLGFKIQGLLPRRQAELADRISEAIAERFLTHDDILAFIRQVDPVAAMRHLLISKWEEKLGEVLESMPFIKMFVNPEKLTGIRDKIADAFASEAETFTKHLVDSLAGKIDLKATLRRNILAFDVTQLNDIIEKIGYREFREIAWIGGALGVVIGLIQAAVNAFALP